MTLNEQIAELKRLIIAGFPTIAKARQGMEIVEELESERDTLRLQLAEYERRYTAKEHDMGVIAEALEVAAARIAELEAENERLKERDKS